MTTVQNKILAEERHINFQRSVKMQERPLKRLAFVGAPMLR